MIYRKLDWFTCVFYNTTINRLLDLFDLPDDFKCDLLQGGFERSRGYDVKFIFSLEGFNIEFSYNNILTIETEKLFDTVISDIRVDISGRGLDFLRSFGFDVDTVFTSPSFFGQDGTYNITRSDFAFDFVNYKPDFLSNLLDYLKSIPHDSRVMLGGCRAVKFDYHKSTAYLGCGGDKMLRVYDKKLEQTQNGFFRGDVKQFAERDHVVASWFRIELQTRRKCATSCLFTCNGDISNVARYIFDNYKIYDDNKQVLPFILDLYDWENVYPLIECYSSVQLVPIRERSHRYVLGQSFSSIVTTLAIYGANKLIDDLNIKIVTNALINLPSYQRQYRGLNYKLTLLSQQEQIELKKLPFITFIQHDGIEIPFLRGGNLPFTHILNDCQLYN